MKITSRFAFKLILILLLLVQQLAMAQPLQAAGECTVGEGYATIQAAVNDAQCTSIQVPAGAYEENVFVVRSLSITGAGADVTVVQGSGAASVFFIMKGITVSLSGLTITGGTGSDLGDGNTYGGGILNGGALTMAESVITNNRATIGGGIISVEGSLHLVDSTIADNHAKAAGGGIANLEGELTVENSTIRDNSADTGGGILAYMSMVKVSNSVIRANQAASSGGGLYVETEFQQPGRVSIERSTIHDNSAESAGGIYTRFGSLEVDQSTISANRADEAGGGIYAELGNVGIIRSTLSGNEAQQGGAIYCYFTRVTYIGYNTISENRAQAGGGLFAELTMYALSYNILSRNVGGACSGNATLLEADHNLVEDDSCSGVQAISGDPMLSPLADNGGPTQTYVLLPGSPAIDAIPMGTEACADPTASIAKGGTIFTDPEMRHTYGNDQRGVTRPQGAGCDIGAYEVEARSSISEAAVAPAGEEGTRAGVSLYGVLVRVVSSIVARQWELFSR
jgi:hypothetical protein